MTLARAGFLVPQDLIGACVLSLKQKHRFTH
jgi:hypothetical protein